MELDPRIKDRKDIFDCFNADEAKKYIGKECYISDYLYRFRCIDNVIFTTLLDINDQGKFVTNLNNKQGFDFCLPAEMLIKPAKAKKWRPYTFEEFFEKFTIGIPIKFRKRGDVGNELYLILTGYRNTDNYTVVYIGGIPYTLDELFNEYEWQSAYTEDFQPFGVEE